MTFFQQLQADTKAQRQYLLEAPLIQRCMQNQTISLEEYLQFLTQAYHHVKHTVPLLMAVGFRLRMDQEPFREAIAEYIEEELGHQRWILDDIRAAGGNAELAQASKPLPATELMVAYAYDTITRINPMAFFGMVLVLEGTSINLATAAAERIQKQLGLPDSAFSYLRSHGSLDQEHMVFFEKLMNSISSAQDQSDICHAAKMFYTLYGNIFREVADSCASAPLAMAVGD